MQIFQPCETWRECAQYLKEDPKRLGKQAVEIYQIYNAVLSKIEQRKHGYMNHPMVLHVYNLGKPYDIFNYIEELNKAWYELGYIRNPEFLKKIEILRLDLIPHFTDEPYKPFFCKGNEYSYDDVYEKYKRLLEEKRQGTYTK